MKRTHRHYDGVFSPTKSLSSLLSEALDQLKTERQAETSEVLLAWASIAGPQIAKMSEAVSCINGVLTVHVKSSSLYSVLRTYEQPKLLRLLQQRFSPAQVRDLVFRIGRI